MKKEGIILDALSVACDKSPREGRWSTVGEVNKNIDPKLHHEISYHEVYPTLKMLFEDQKIERKEDQNHKATFPPMFRKNRSAGAGGYGSASKPRGQDRGPDGYRGPPDQRGKDGDRGQDGGDRRDKAQEEVTARMIQGIMGGGISGSAPRQ